MGLGLGGFLDTAINTVTNAIGVDSPAVNSAFNNLKDLGNLGADLALPGLTDLLGLNREVKGRDTPLVNNPPSNISTPKYNDLLSKTSLELSNGDPKGAAIIDSIIRGGDHQAIRDLAEQLGYSWAELAALNLGVPLPKKEKFTEVQPGDSSVQEEVLKREQAGLKSRLDELYKTVFNEGVTKISDAATPIRQRAITEQRLMGRAGSPLEGQSLGRLDQAQVRAIGELSGNMAQQRSTQEFQLMQAIESLLAQERRSKENLGVQNRNLAIQNNLYGLQKQGLAADISQFAKKFDLSQRELQQNADLAREGLASKLELQRREFENSEPSNWDRALQAAQIANYTSSAMENTAAAGGGGRGSGQSMMKMGAMF